MFITVGVIIALVLYGVFVFGISRKAEKAMAGKEQSTEFLVAGRNVGPIALLGTVCLSIWSALAFFGYGAGLYRAGIGYYAGAVGAFFVGLYAPTVMYRLWLLGKKYHYCTPGDFFQHRYNSPFLRVFIAIVLAICTIPYIAVQISGVANGIVVTTQGRIGFWIAVIVLCVYMWVHVMKGGNKAVVGTDVFAGFAGVGIAILTTIVLVSLVPGAGSLTKATKTISETHPEMFKMSGSYATISGFLGLAISAGMSIIAWPHIFVRSYMAKGERVFKMMGIAFPICELVAFGCFMLQGIWAGRAAYPDLTGAATDNIIPQMAQQYAPAIFAILLVVGVFAFGLSTADSQFVVLSSLIDDDIIKKKASVRNKQIIFVILLALILVVVKFRPPFLVTYAYSFCAPGFAQLMPAMFGGLYWKRSTKEGAIAGTVVGVAAVMFTLFIKNPIPWLQPILWGLILGTILFVCVSLATKPDAEAVEAIHKPLDDFFKSRNTLGHKVCMFFSVVIFIQLILVSPKLPGIILFGWCPLPVFNWICGAVELAVLGYFYGKNRLFEADGNTKQFA
ncbi:MAG: sodium:solute symporter family protein [Spirochaetaceae bacterium]|jgi:SSS family solute:Na+ symporter|nr:sodium:solute symporter family protein [Spirochaetaceae bacterium]